MLPVASGMYQLRLDISSYFSSTKLRPLAQPTSHLCAHTDKHKDTLCGFKEQLFNISEENTLLYMLRLLQNHSKASPSTSALENPELWQKKTKKFLDGGKRGDREEAWSRDVTHAVTYIFLFFPTTDNCEEGGGLRLMNIHAKVFPVRSVGQPNSIMGDWLSPQVGPIFFTYSAPASPSISSFHFYL